MKYRVVFEKYKLHHVFLWGLFFAGWYFFRVADFPNHIVAIKITFVKVIWLAFLVYTTNNLLIPKLLYKKRYVLFAFIYLSLILLAGLLKIYINEKLLSPFFQGLDVFADFKER